MPDDHASPMRSLAERAAHVMPGGGFGNFDPTLVIARGDGSRVWDEDGREYVDLLIGSGPMYVGHSHPEVVEAVARQLPLGQTFFANSRPGIELAERIVEDMACADQVRFVSSGSEADMYAIRLARAHTGRDLILKFEGGYHGMSDHGLMSTTPQVMVNYPLAVPDSAGIVDGVRDATLVCPWADAEVFTDLLDEYGSRIAGVIIEPLQRIMPPPEGWLELVRAETKKRGLVLIFDEVVTGYRLAYGGAQEKYGVVPDLCTLGKVIGGGFPLAAIAGREDIMAHFDKARVGPEGYTHQVGTLSGNPIAAVAGLATMDILRRDGAYEKIRANGEALMTAARQAFEGAGIPVQIVGDPVLFDIVFSETPIRNYRDVMRADKAAEARSNALLRERGVLKPMGKVYVHLALTDDDIAKVGEAFRSTAEAMAGER